MKPTNDVKSPRILFRIFLALVGAASLFLASELRAQPTFGPSGEGSIWVPANLTTTISTIATVPAGSRRFLTGFHFYNPNAAACYVQVFDAATATLGTTVPKMHFYVPPANGIFLGTYDYSFGPAEVPTFTTALIAYATTAATNNVACTSAIDAQFSVR